MSELTVLEELIQLRDENEVLKHLIVDTVSVTHIAFWKQQHDIELPEIEENTDG